MSAFPGAPERVVQDNVIRLFTQELDYAYLGDWHHRTDNSNLEVAYLEANLRERGYTPAEISGAVRQLRTAAHRSGGDLLQTNQRTYQLLRYGADVRVRQGENTRRVAFIDWYRPERNHFAIAEEVTVRGWNDKRPDIVIYVNGIALGVLELKRNSVSIGEAVRQNVGNQRTQYIADFFSTVQFIFAGNETEGLRYGTVGTPAKFYTVWKEDIADNTRNKLEKYLLKLCAPARFLEIIRDFVVFDGGVKKLPRVHQYFGVRAAQHFVNEREGGIIWHTQGSGKSITMVYLAKWILENRPDARILLVTDRDELDKQIERVFKEVGQKVYRVQSGEDLMEKLTRSERRILTTLVHKFGKRGKGSFEQYIEQLRDNPPPVRGELFVFVDECHRTQSNKLHRAMKTVLPAGTVFIGFTGTPLLKNDRSNTMQVFGRYIHTYKYNEGVADGVILPLVYEARDVDQKLSSESAVDRWFDAKTRGLNDFQQSALKKQWGTMQRVLSSASRMGEIVADITLDFGTLPRLDNGTGNAILVARSIYEACQYYKLFQKTPLRGQCAIITSYSPNKRDDTNEETGANTETDRQVIYNLYSELTENRTTEQYEDWAKEQFTDYPGKMKLLIVVSKLLTGFDVPSCTYLYIDKSMQDHGLFQAICRVNRLDGEEKLFGQIIDYRDLFKRVENAMAVYTSELDAENFEQEDIDILLENRLHAGRQRLENALEALHVLCEPVAPPRTTFQYIQYFCGNTELEEDLKRNEPKRISLYKNVATMLRAYASIKDNLEAAGYDAKAQEKLGEEINGYLKRREEIRMAAQEYLDLKSYEADMRHLIDTYIKADTARKVSDFGDLTLLEIIEHSGIRDAIGQLPDGIRRDRRAVAETIENNVRSTIIRDKLVDPAYYEKMSKLLDALVRQRKQEAISYEDYLDQIAELARKARLKEDDELPAAIQTAAQRALFHNLNGDEALTLKIDEMVSQKAINDWRGNDPAEKDIQRVIYDTLRQYETAQAQETPAQYHILDRVREVFKIVVEQREDY